MKAFAAFGVFGEVERQDRNRELQFGRMADRTDRPQRVIGVVREILHLRIVFVGHVDRNAVGGAVEFARQERLVVGAVVPGRAAGDEGVGQRLGVFQRLHRLRRIDDDLVVLVDGVGAVAPQNPVQPAIGVAGRMSEREAGRRVVLLQRLAHFEEAREVRREFLEARLLHRRSCGRSCSRRRSRRECRASRCPSCRSWPPRRSSRRTSCRDSRRHRSSSALWSGTAAAACAGPRPYRGPGRCWRRPKPSAARPRRTR